MDRVAMRRFLPPPVDILIAAVLLAMGWALALGNTRVFEESFEEYEGPATWLLLLLVAVATVPVVFRRVVPLGSLVVITVGQLLMTIYDVVEFSASVFAALLALVSAGVYGRPHLRDWARGLFAVAVLAIFVAAFISSSGVDTTNISPQLMVAVATAQFALNAGLIWFGWYWGDVERRRRAADAELADRNRELQAALEMVDSQAANEERLAIAREVHDIVGHTVSLLGVQAAAARRHLEHDVDAAEAILKTMEDQSRGAVDEIRSLIAVLRGSAVNGNSPTSAPTPSFAQLDGLIEEVRTAGVAVAYARTGPSPSSPGLGLSIYRVVQEALSNARRHGDGNVEVVVDCDRDEVRLFVSNDMVDERTGVNGDWWRAGSGLAGMRERVGLHGGDLSAGRSRDGRFEVKAVLPMPSTTSTSAVDVDFGSAVGDGVVGDPVDDDPVEVRP